MRFVKQDIKYVISALKDYMKKDTCRNKTDKDRARTSRIHEILDAYKKDPSVFKPITIYIRTESDLSGQWKTDWQPTQWEVGAKAIFVAHGIVRPYFPDELNVKQKDITVYMNLKFDSSLSMIIQPLLLRNNIELGYSTNTDLFVLTLWQLMKLWK